MFHGRNRKNPLMSTTTEDEITSSSSEDYLCGETPSLVKWCESPDPIPPEDERDMSHIKLK